jgi:hypothetical protein
VASVGGVVGMLGGAAEGAGFTEVSVDVVELDEGLDIVSVVVPVVAPIEVVAEVSVDAPVEAVEPDHQSLLARALGEAFI